MKRIKPCFYCGSEPRLISGTQRDGKYIAVALGQCDCSTVKWCDSDDKTIDWWNAPGEAIEIIAAMVENADDSGHSYECLATNPNSPCSDGPCYVARGRALLDWVAANREWNRYER